MRGLFFVRNILYHCVMKNLLKIGLDPGRIYGLDILRACAILFVVLAHGNPFLPIAAANVVNYFVFDGVSIFFVLSGFLIGGILIKILENTVASKKTLLDFWIRRWFRTLPAYFLVLTIVAVMSFLMAKSFDGSVVWKYYIFSQNLFTEHPLFFEEAWSLSIEEWFYLTVPTIIFSLIAFLKFTPRKSVLLTALFIILIVTGFRFFRYMTIPVNDAEQFNLIFRKQVSMRLDSLMYGVIGAYVSYYAKEKWLRAKKSLLIIGLLLFALSNYIASHVFELYGLYFSVFHCSVTSLATLSLLPFLSDYKKGAGFFYRAITYISLISYSLYLLNLSLIGNFVYKFPIERFISDGNVVSVVKYIMYWVLNIVFSALLYKYFEVPMTKLRDNKTIKKFLYGNVEKKDLKPTVTDK